MGIIPVLAAAYITGDRRDELTADRLQRRWNSLLKHRGMDDPMSASFVSITGSGVVMDLSQVAAELRRRLLRLFPPDSTGARPCFTGDSSSSLILAGIRMCSSMSTSAGTADAASVHHIRRGGRDWWPTSSSAVEAERDR